MNGITPRVQDPECSFRTSIRQIKINHEVKKWPFQENTDKSTYQKSGGMSLFLYCGHRINWLKAL